MKLNTQGNEIVTAIKAGIAAGGVDEWDSPEFEAARKASEGYVWEFAGWADTLACIERHGALGGDSLDIRYEDVRGCGMGEQVADFRATWPNGNDPDGETQVAIYVHSCGGLPPYIVRAAQLLRAALPLRNCRACGFVAASGKVKQESRAKVSPERRHEIAAMGGAANKRKSGFGDQIRSIALAMLADGLTWREVATVIGCSMTTLHRWRKAKSNGICADQTIPVERW